MIITIETTSIQKTCKNVAGRNEWMKIHLKMQKIDAGYLLMTKMYQKQRSLRSEKMLKKKTCRTNKKWSKNE